MSDLGPKTLNALRTAFEEFKYDPRFQLQIKLRRYRLSELRELLTNPDSIDLDTFNREVWRLETYSEHNGQDITGIIYQDALSNEEPIPLDKVAELDAALDAGEIRFHGNSMWGSGTYVYGSMLHETAEQKVAYIRRALDILNELDLSPIEKANQIIAIPGFGPNIATGLVTVFHPDEFTIFNSPPKRVLDELQLEARTLEAFQDSMRTLRDQLEAKDFLELDWFLYLISRDVITLETQTRYWWVNQGGTYSYECAGNYIWAPKISRAGRTVQHHQNLKHIQPGDVILHYAQGALRAVSRVVEAYEEAQRPVQLSELRWEPEGYLVRTEYTELEVPIELHEIPIEWRNLEDGPFDRKGAIKQGYLFPITRQFIESLGNRFSDRVPEYVPRASKTQQVWIFQADPTLFDLQSRLADVQPGEEESWTVTRYESEMKAGDIVLLWKAGDAAGIYAIAELTGTFFDRERVFSDQRGSERAATMRYREVLSQPILKGDLRDHPVLQDLHVIRSPQGTNFRVTDTQWEALQSFITRSRLNVEGYTAPSFEAIRAELLEQGLRLTDDQIRQFHLALYTSRLVVLAGNSGTGKTWLAEAYSRAVNAEYIIVPVAPNWTTNEDLLGYYNPIDQTYYDTPFSSFLRRAAAAYQRARDAGVRSRPYHLILDEMNLARVEYYFARFLSAMEITARGGEGRIELSSDDVVFLPPTLRFIGTVNVDETTHAFADKVYDRAQLVQLESPRELIVDHLGNSEYADTLLEIWDALYSTAPFGYRVLDQIAAYVHAADEHGTDWHTALDEQLVHKILPKIKGAEPHIGTSLSKLEEISRDEFPLTHSKVVEMYDRFKQHGFTSFF